jgi:hypothetical protein
MSYNLLYISFARNPLKHNKQHSPSLHYSAVIVSSWLYYYHLSQKLNNKPSSIPILDKDVLCGKMSALLTEDINTKNLKPKYPADFVFSPNITTE